MRDKRVYALLTRRCNLTCPYCDVRNGADDFNHDKFMEELSKFDGTITLFGGEPTLYRDRLKEIVYDSNIGRKVRSISTNLMVVDNELIKILNDVGGISTSWNPSRFRDGEYRIWKRNLDIINGKISLRVLVTMTFELLEMDPYEAAKIMATWNANTVHDITFENLIDDKVDEEYFRRTDEWLCKVYDYRNIITPQLRCNMGSTNPPYMDCSNIYTLNPDGTWKNGCPHAQQAYYTSDKCYSCELSSLCRPCRLQRYCSFPKNLYKKLQSEMISEE